VTGRRPAGAGGAAAGFALVAVMLIGAMASVAAASLFTVAMASANVANADRRSELARAAADSCLVDVVERLQWGLAGNGAAQVPESYSTGLDGEASCTVGLTRRLPGAGWPSTYDVDVTAGHGAARAALNAVVEVAPTRLPSGVSVSGEVSCAAQFTVRGCGIYAGADVRGRDKITFEAADGGVPPAADPLADCAHADLWPTCAVHAGGRIYRAGSEEHVQAGPEPADTDACTGGTPPRSVTAGPSSALVADIAGRSPALQTPYAGNSLDLSTLVGPASAGGLVVVAAATSQPLSITGRRAAPPLAPRLTLVVLGDACIVPGPVPAPQGVGMSGVLVVTGTLTVQAAADIRGSLFAGELAVEAPLLVELAGGWRDQPPPGSLSAQVLAQW
jgi:hypothetical protein